MSIEDIREMRLRNPETFREDGLGQIGVRVEVGANLVFGDLGVLGGLRFSNPRSAMLSSQRCTRSL